MALAAPSIDEAYALEDRYRKERGRVLITGTQALVRLPLAQRRLDRARGLRTAGFVSGYRGSPVAGYDLALRQAQKLLEAEDVRFVPGINEELAAAAVMGSQQVEAEGHGRFDGVFAIWYGKGPGLDRAGDAIKHGHAYGTSPHGGVLCVVGDDHGAVSSTVAHQSDQSFAAWSMPVLHPASVRDYLELGLWGWAASRFSGGWVGFKAISETIESAQAFELPDELPVFATPADFTPPPDGLHFRWRDPPSVAIETRLLHKLDAIRAFARANPVDRLVVEAPDARLGIVAVGKAYGDVMEALSALGLGERELQHLGVRVLKVALSFPLEAGMALGASPAACARCWSSRRSGRWSKASSRSCCSTCRTRTVRASSASAISRAGRSSLRAASSGRTGSPPSSPPASRPTSRRSTSACGCGGWPSPSRQPRPRRGARPTSAPAARTTARPACPTAAAPSPASAATSWRPGCRTGARPASAPWAARA